MTSLTLHIETNDGRLESLLIDKNAPINNLYKLAAQRLDIAADTFKLRVDEDVLDQTKVIGDYALRDLQLIKLILIPQLKPLPGYISLTDEPCCVSYDDDKSERRAMMPCGCSISVDGMHELCTSTIGKGNYTLNCPGCEKPWEFFLARHVLAAKLTPEQLIDISRQLDENFVLRPQHDIRQCYMCRTYSQRLDHEAPWLDNGNRVVCNVCTKKNGGNSVEFCWLCGQQWNDDESTESCGNTNCGGPSAAINTLATCGTANIEYLGFSGVPNTRACPECGLLITHETGCKHMTCTMCECNFCFVCLKAQDSEGEWQCGDYDDPCEVAPRQTRLPRR